MRGFLGALAVAAALASNGCSSEPSLTAEQRASFERFITPAPPEGIDKLDVDLDGKVHLVGVALSPKQALYPPGTKVTAALVWRCEQKLGSGHRLFSHLVGQGGVSLGNLDAEGPLRHMEGVVGQPFSPSRWEPGKYYRDEVTFTIPADPSPEVRLYAGIFKGDKRLPIVGRGGDKEQRAQVARFLTGAKDMRQAIKELTVPKLDPTAALTIDGRLDEPAWAKAAATGSFVDVGSGRANPSSSVQGNAKLLWDDTFLYVGFEVKEAKIRGGFPKDAKDPHLWERDTVEIMIDPDGDGDNKDYYEIQISPQNLVFDTQYDGYNSPNGNGKGPFGHEEWSANLVSAVSLHGTIDDDSDIDEGYTVEAKIPWASFTKALHSPPLPTDSWRMNFYAMKNNGGVAWSPILGMGNFHRASRFGRVRFQTPASEPAASVSAP